MGTEKITAPLSDHLAGGRRHELGRVGERMAAELLERSGLIVLDRNWRCSRGELDIVATDGDVVVFCEVKARSGVDYGGPLHAIGPDKIARVRGVARAWLSERDLVGCRVRFDVVSVLWPPGETARVEHLAGVF
ncbi:YraN family protein [Saccharopolyspora sp. NPDC049426]|uniref:YraN family protein n=1 Tax=Saccharopolyspora sp. NPDC049426 TaxID=3155652 RepID=UPI0034372DA9